MSIQDALDYVLDMREYDVPYHVRFAIDNDIRCGHWFTVSCKVGVLDATSGMVEACYRCQL
jgi:DNA polymerase epsilon subunit 1